MTKLKERTILNKEELAKSLLTLARQLVEGKLSFQDINRQIPARLEVKYKYKNKEGFSKFKISFKWPDVETPPINTAYQALNARDIPLTKVKEDNSLVASSYKEFKKQLEAIMNSISNTISSEGFPAVEQVEKLILLTEASTKKAKPKLVKGMQTIEKVVLDLKKAVEAKDIEQAKQKIKLLYQLKEKYHQQYK